MLALADALALASETEPERRVELSALGLLATTECAAVAVTRVVGADRRHVFAFSAGYATDPAAYMLEEFIPHDPLSRRWGQPGAAIETWRETGFADHYVAKRWLKPAGFCDGVSTAIVDPAHGVVGSLHASWTRDGLGDGSREAITSLGAFLALALRDLRARDDAGLTVREREVTRLIALGASNPEIAQALLISRRTVATHVESILRKLGAESRVIVAVQATRLGIV